MISFQRTSILALILFLFLFWGSPLPAAETSDGPVVKSKKTIHKGAKKKKPKRSNRKKKQKKTTSNQIKKAIPSTMVTGMPGLEEKSRPQEVPALRPPVVVGGPVQNLIENEIIHLKAIRQLLPGDEISLQVYDLNAKKMLSDINGKVVRNAASLIKLYVLMAVYEAIARQDLQETAEIERHIYRMIAISDNGSTNALIQLLGQGDAQKGMDSVNALVRSIGFSGTRLKELIPEGGKTYANQTSAADTTLFYRLLYDQKLVSPYYSQKMNDVLLKNIHYRIKTPQINQDGVAVADKTGYVRGLNGDCGIVYQKGQQSGCDYALSIIIENKSRPSTGGWGKKKTAVIRHLSNQIYQALKNGQAKS